MLVSSEDVHLAMRHNWHVSAYGYAVTNVYKNGVRTQIKLHRLIMGVEDENVDHINMDTLDNRRGNLRHANWSHNAANRTKITEWRGRTCTSKYKGVSWHKKNQRWVAYIKRDQKRIYLGSFGDQIEAANAYNRAATGLFGEFARLNPT
jgi:hypothetical protein